MLSRGLTIVFLSGVFVVELVQDRVFQDASLGSLSFVSAATSSVCSIQRMEQGAILDTDLLISRADSSRSYRDQSFLTEEMFVFFLHQ